MCNMTKKTVSDLIFDKFAESIENDDLFNDISNQLIALVREGGPNKDEIKELLMNKQNEDSRTLH